MAKRAPVVIFFYGGGWTAGDRGMYLFVGEAFASRRFATVIPDYRLYPEVRYPAFLQDAAAAVRWTVDHIAGQGDDPPRIYPVGHSAGAYIAAMLTLDRRWLGAVRVDPRRQIRGMVGLAAPMTFCRWIPTSSGRSSARRINGPRPSRSITSMAMPRPCC
jgi:acetyl esterase/lipase